MFEHTLVGPGLPVWSVAFFPDSRKMRAPGRNDPCPCGSGKKFKHCHGAPETLHGAASSWKLGQLPSLRCHLYGRFSFLTIRDKQT